MYDENDLTLHAWCQLYQVTAQEHIQGYAVHGNIALCLHFSVNNVNGWHTDNQIHW